MVKTITILKNTLDWTKNKFRKFWKWIVGILIPIAFAATLIPSPVPAPEIISADWNSNTIQVEDKLQTTFSAKWINYLDQDNSWKEINTEFRKTPEDFVMDNAPFKVSVPLRSTGVAFFINDNRFDIADDEVIDEPELTQTIQAINVAVVDGKIEVGDLGWGETEYVVYLQAYPTYDADLIYWVHNGKSPVLRKLIRFNSIENAPSENADFEFAISYSEPVYIQRNIRGEKVGWTRKNDIKNYEGDVVVKLTGSMYVNDQSKMRGIGMEKFKIWDSGQRENRKIESVKVDIKKTDSMNDFVLVKHIKSIFFQDAIFPVFTDTTSTFYPDAGTGNTTVDGDASRQTAGAWATIRAGAGTHSDDVGGDLQAQMVATTNANEYAVFYRAAFTFNTAAIPDTDVISATTFSAFQSWTGDTLTNQAVGIVNVTLTNANAVVAADFSNFGTTRYASDIDLGSIAAGAYNNFAFNATGIAAVNKTGITQIGMRISGDIDNVDPWVSGNNATFRALSADQAGTANDPKLVVVHAAPVSRRIIIGND